MAGHVTPRKVCAKDGCEGTIRKHDAPESKRETIKHWQAGRCTRCGGAKFRKKWRARYPDPSYGGRKEIERNFDRRTDADRWLRNQQVDADRGVHIDPTTGGQRLGTVVVAWRSTWIDLEPKTKAGYESILNRHVLPRWRDARIGAVSADAIQTWVNEIAESRSRTTVTHIYNVMRLVMGFAVARRYRSDNPCDAVKLPSKRKDNSTKREMLFLTPAEVASLADAITPRFRLVVYVSSYIGLRAGEVEAVRRKDVDLLHSRLSVVLALKDINSASENIADEDKGLIFGPPKNGETRVVVIPKFMKPMFEERLAVVPKKVVPLKLVEASHRRAMAEGAVLASVVVAI